MIDVDIPEEYRPFLRIGTCSWKYDSWKGLYYDSDRRYRVDDYLPDYVRRLDTVEIDQWFWCLFPGGLRLPEPDTVRNYAESVPADFKFTVKAPNALTLTHFYAKQLSQHVEFAGRPNIYFFSVDLLNRFLKLLAPLGDKLGPIMFQFEYLNRRKMPSRDAFLDRFGDFIDQAPHGFEYALETRNPGFLTGQLFDFLRERNIGYVYIDGYSMPPLANVFERFKPATAQFSIVRLMGPDRATMERQTGKVWNRIVAPKEEGLSAAAKIVRANMQRKVRTYLNVNNHYEGSAPLTIERFLQALREEKAL